MITPSNKINVFISSICGNEESREKYNIIRRAMKDIIEYTNLANVYLFEDNGASILSAQDHYMFSLENSDICIFLIDNADGITPGVQAEIDCANKHSIKSLYYFCDKTCKEETPLQKSLMGAKFAKSKPVHSFEEMIQVAAQDLLDNLLMIFRSYCKGQIEIAKQEDNNPDMASIPDTYLVPSQEVTANVDLCKSYFANLILGEKVETKSSSEFDEALYAFLPVLFENKSIREVNLHLFLQKLKGVQEAKNYSVTEKRWEAIEDYFLGDLNGCVSSLKDALKLAKENAMPDWIIMDILIDLRNQLFLLGECNNYCHYENEAQEEISQSPHEVYYPLIDRLDSNLYEEYSKSALDRKTQSPYTVVLGNNLMPQVEKITNIYILSMYSGSLTHLLGLYKRIKLLAFNLCVNYSNWRFRTLLLEMVIIDDHDADKTEGITRAFGEILCKMDSSDAKQIYELSSNNPIHFQKFICNLEAFNVTGYFLSDDDFQLISKDIIRNINSWIEDDKRCYFIGAHIFNALSGTALRLKQDDLVLICCKVLEHGLAPLYNKMFQLITNYVDAMHSSPLLINRLIKDVLDIVVDKKKRENINSLKSALCSLRLQSADLTSGLDKSIQENMPDFYGNEYLLETTKNRTTDMPVFIEKYVREIKSENSTQGKNGQYVGYWYSSYGAIKNILELNEEIAFEDNLIDSIVKEASDTLLTERQTINAKCEAIELLVFVFKRYPDSIIRNNTTIQTLKKSRNIIETGYSVISNLTDISLRFSAQLLYSSLGDEVWSPVLEILSCLNDDLPNQIHASEAIVSYLEARKNSSIEAKLESVILQSALHWCNSECLDMRVYAIRILFQLLSNTENTSIICNQLVKSMDSDDVFIKKLILKNIKELESADKATYDYIMQKALIDPNFVVRRECTREE